ADEGVLRRPRSEARRSNPHSPDSTICGTRERDLHRHVACLWGNSAIAPGIYPLHVHYRRVSNACMAVFFFGHKLVHNATEYIMFCINTPGCKSVDYGSHDTCLINFVNRRDRPLTIGCDDKNEEKFDYYELVCESECPNEKHLPQLAEDICANDPTICKHG
ncbi:hypothetical protein B4U79_11843, partial [Dinothrombium tinctorium]